MTTGFAIAFCGAALSTILAGIGSGLSVGRSGQVAAGTVSENPELFGKVLILQLLPGTQGIYGLLVTFVALVKLGILGGQPLEMSVASGLSFFLACMPIAIVGLLSALYQGKTAISSISLVAKRPDQFGKAMLFPAMVETYAILALLVSILAVANFKI